MKKKEVQNLKTETLEKLQEKVRNLKKKIKLDYMKTRVGQEKNLKLVKNQRRDMAQTLTIIGQKKGEK